MIQIRLVLNKSGSVNLFRLMINPRAFPNPWKVLSIFRISFGTGSATAIVPAGFNVLDSFVTSCHLFGHLPEGTKLPVPFYLVFE
jgi:hypothetical protein